MAKVDVLSVYLRPPKTSKLGLTIGDLASRVYSLRLKVGSKNN